MTAGSALDPSWRDPSRAPHDDFYRHANGRWLDENPVPPEYGSWGAFHEVQVRNEELLRELLEDATSDSAPPGRPERMAGDFYASGMNVDQIEAAGIDPLRPWLERIDSIAAVEDLRDYAGAAQLAGIPHFFGSYVAPDFDDSTRYLLYLTQGGLGLPERDYYFRDDDRSLALRAAYRGHVAAMLGLLGETADPVAGAAAVLDVETELARASLTPAEHRDVDRTTNKRAVDELRDLMPPLDLPAYLSDLGVRAGAVNLDHPDFFTAAGGLIGEVDMETWKTYLRWHLVRATASSLPTRFEEEAFDFYGRKLGGQQRQKERWKRILSAATSDIGEQVSRLFVAVAFPPEAKARCEQMVAHLLAAMGDSIRGLDWMGEGTKVEALKKLAGFRYKIGYPEKWRDYSGLVVDTGPFISNRMRAAAFEIRRKLDRLDRPVESEWEMPPHVVNAYYHPLHNEIVFPAGILQPPFFDSDADDPVNYGGIGSVIGHEITHGFDDQGSKFDPDGNLRNWWTEADRAEFEARAAGLVAQYNSYEAVAGAFVNGELTLGENIADLGGLSVAYHALLKALGDGRHGVEDLTPQRRFFLSYATIWRMNYTDEYVRLLVTTDPHAPHDVRCNGPLENFPPFRAAFGISEGSPMARSAEHVVRIW